MSSETSRITPACAGKSDWKPLNLLFSGDHPRLRGEKNFAKFVFGEVRGSPPLARGKVVTSITSAGNERITPACAGKSYGKSKALNRARDHPRLRGEKSERPRRNQLARGSPPLARGKDTSSNGYVQHTRITPACAGKSWSLPELAGLVRDHPRLRGEKMTTLHLYLRWSGSPPLARGKGRVGVKGDFRRGITPACAGKSSVDRLNDGFKEDHPRLRGEKIKGHPPH